MNRIKCFFVEDTGKTKSFEFKNEAGEIVASGTGRIFRRTDTGEEIDNLSDLPAGAMYFAEWYDAMFEPQLEHVLVVKTPGGDWIVDSESSNCTMPATVRREGNREIHPKKQTDHHCWIIEGDLPAITVSKNGRTCAAGAGSILCGGYHGFLRNGYLEEC